MRPFFTEDKIGRVLRCNSVGYAYIDHGQQLVTQSFKNIEALKRNTDILRTDMDAEILMRDRYNAIYKGKS